MKIALRAGAVEKLIEDPSVKAMIYCASDPISTFSKVEINFPYQVEIKVNQDEVKANLRGLKNKPGSTRPADITNLLRKRAGYENSLTVMYALTNKVGYLKKLFPSFILRFFCVLLDGYAQGVWRLTAFRNIIWL